MYDGRLNEIPGMFPESAIFRHLEVHGLENLWKNKYRNMRLHTNWNNTVTYLLIYLYYGFTYLL